MAADQNDPHRHKRIAEWTPQGAAESTDRYIAQLEAGQIQPYPSQSLEEARQYRLQLRAEYGV